MSLRVVLLAACWIFWPREAAAQAPVRVLASNGVRAAMLDLRPQLEQAIGRKLDLQFSSTAALKKRIQAGETFDATVITTEAIAELAREGKAQAGTEIGFSRLGIGARTGLKKPDIQTAETLKQALLNAKSVTYPGDGASRPYLESLFDRMGIAEKMKVKAYLADGSAAATASVAHGKSELVITLYSEVIPVHGLEMLGPLPGALAYQTAFSAASASGTKSADPVKALVGFLAGSMAEPALRANGIERRK